MSAAFASHLAFSQSMSSMSRSERVRRLMEQKQEAERERDAYENALRDVRGYLRSNTWTRPEIAGYIDRVLDGEPTHIGTGPDKPTQEHD